MTTTSFNLTGSSALKLDGTNIADGSSFVQAGSDLIGTGGCGPSRNHTATDATAVTISTTDHLVTVDAASHTVPVNLPAAPSYAKEYTIFLTAKTSGSVEVNCDGTETFFQGATSSNGKVTLDTAGQFVKIMANSDNGWLVLSTGDSTLTFAA